MILLGECCFTLTKPRFLRPNADSVSNDHRRRIKRVQCLRKCELLDFHQELIPYEVAWSLQKHIVKQKKSQIQNEGDCDDTLIVLQHPSVFTLGTASSNNNLNFDIKNPPFHVHRTERGGEVTYHGPGQVCSCFNFFSFTFCFINLIIVIFVFHCVRFRVLEFSIEL